MRKIVKNSPVKNCSTQFLKIKLYEKKTKNGNGWWR